MGRRLPKPKNSPPAAKQPATENKPTYRRVEDILPSWEVDEIDNVLLRVIDDLYALRDCEPSELPAKIEELREQYAAAPSKTSNIEELREQYGAMFDQLVEEQEEHEAALKLATVPRESSDALAEAVEAFLLDLDYQQPTAALDKLVIFGGIDALRELLRVYDAASERRERAYDAAEERGRAALMKKHGNGR